MKRTELFLCLQAGQLARPMGKAWQYDSLMASRNTCFQQDTITECPHAYVTK
jgi:hypothetical protein